MRIIFTKHARERMQERDISEEEIMECIQYPTKVLKESKEIFRFQKSSADGTIEVIAGIKKSHLIVITVYPL